MKRISATFIAILMVGMSILAGNLRVGTYNLRLENNNDYAHNDGWTQRRHAVIDLLNFMEPMVFGTQEGLVNQLNDIRSGLDGYEYIGHGREDGKQGGEFAAIFYKKDAVTLLDTGDFWLSETPDRPGKGWDAACVRICTWGKFRVVGTRFTFYFFNLHMDHIGIEARREGAKLVVSKISEIAKGAPVILTGDFNVDQTNEIYSIFTGSGLLDDTYVKARKRMAPNGTFNSFKPALTSTSRIDHVMVSPKFKVGRYGILTNIYWEVPTTHDTTKGNDAPGEINFTPSTIHAPSDHYPVIVELEF